jgi:hypothetical protein
MWEWLEKLLLRSRRGVARLAVAGLVVVLATLGVSGPASAGIDGCSGSAQSRDADGDVVDEVTAAGGRLIDGDGKPVFTAANPFEVENDGTVDYDGQTDDVITDHTWSLEVLGVSVASGGSPNADREQRSEDTFDLDEELPFPITGLVKVEGEISGRGGSCSGSGYVKVGGDPLASPITWAGGVLAAVGAAGLVLALPRAKRGVA